MNSRDIKIEIPTFTPKHNTEACQTPATPRHLDDVSLENHEDGSDHAHRSDSIPTKLKNWYGHRSFRQIIFSLLSLLSILFVFIGLLVGKIDECSALGFVVSVITLFAPSPLS